MGVAVASKSMSALARNTEINCDTRAANEDCINGGSRTRTKYQYDSASNRIQTTWPDANHINYDFDALNREYQVRENGGVSSGGTVLAAYVYDPLSRRQSLTRGNGSATNYGYDLASRLNTLGQDLAGSSQDLSVTLQYTFASQLQTRSGSNNLYDWSPGAASSTSYVSDGLNRYSTVGSTTFSYSDLRGNLTSDGTNSYTYDVENRLLTASGPTAVTLTYDPLGRLQSSASAASLTQYLYSGTELVAELDGSGNVLRRYVHGPGSDDPIVWYEGSTLTTRNYLHADERGSVIATTDDTGSGTVYTYGPYGEPLPAWTGSRFRYTGQIALPEAHLYYYKARLYSPSLGRFLQTDPIGTKDDLNLYAYVGDDPVDRVDPSGLRYVDIYIWYAHHTSPGHVMVTEHRSQKVLLSQFPVTGLWRGQNVQKGYLETFAAEGRQPDSIRQAWVSDDAAFDNTVIKERSILNWDWNPNKDETQCSTAAVRSLEDGEVSLTANRTGTLMPKTLDEDLGKNASALGNHVQQIANSIAQAKGYDSVTINTNDKTVTATYTPTGSRISHSVTCDANGHCTSH
jgi:RHS repeat-associated protein